MILTCPECATSYFVEDKLVGLGRTVRCTSCGESWRAAPTLPLELRASPDEGAIGQPASRDLSLGALPAEALPRAFRARARDQKKVREAATAGAVWGVIGAGFVLVLVAAMVFRVDVVRLWPRRIAGCIPIAITPGSMDDGPWRQMTSVLERREPRQPHAFRRHHADPRG